MSQTAADAGYGLFLDRLRARERYEPPPRGRGPEKLAGMKWLLERLAHPERNLRIVHVAGTNGKGMTSAMVARLLGDAGRKVGLYTSPHLLDIRERIVLEGLPIGKAEFAGVGATVLDAAGELPAHLYLSYFDLLTAMGFLAFHRAGVEWVVLEVGLGGSSDATNTTAKELCILTHLGMDHMTVLGSTLREIAEQKLGILRPGVPTVLASQPAELRTWLKGRLDQLGSPLIPAPALVCGAPPGPGEKVMVSLPGAKGTEVACTPHRATAARLDCAATALAAAGFLLGEPPPAEAEGRLRAALGTDVPGRLDYRENITLAGGGPPTAGDDRTGGAGAVFPVAVLDGGHNQSALQALAVQLQRWEISSYNLIFGLQKDKMVVEVHAPLRALLRGAERVITLVSRSPRSPGDAELQDFIREAVGKDGAVPPLLHAANAREALLEAAKNPGRPLVVSGSFWMLGDVLAEFEPEP